ncbi:cytochrome P450 [Polyporus arcularius HHB13444]|uniref:Cytochrome P450 n=1 Tax=Polyporus arcularius HHB13444 TaxID=1314778 RepID=A0A5C3P4Y6_9APHY|nr:cytochrome P450 [Polyporus arcularius HHB13444]
MAVLSQASIAASSAPTIFLLLLLILGMYVRYQRNAKYRFPPGPRALPLLGNIHQLPLEYQPVTLAQWGRKYGDIVFAKFFRTPAIILNSREAAEELLEKRSGNYSDRPRFILLNEIMGWDSVINMMRYGDRFRKHRKWLQDALMPKSVLLSYHPMLRRETYTFLAGLCDTPDRVNDHIKRWSAALVFDIAYGHRIASLDDELVTLNERVTEETVLAGSPGSMLVDFFPILKSYPLWLPGSGWMHQALFVRKVLRQSLDIPYERVYSALTAGTARPSVVASLLEAALTEGKLTPAHEDDIKGVAGAILAAGSDTTLTALRTFVMAMILNPDVYKKAQAEIDRVIGEERLLDFDDREKLPYMDCVMQEVLRWNAPVPLGVPHRAIADDIHRGYHIPEGAMMMPNIWWMTQNPELYSEPERFFPDRFLQMSPEEAEQKDPRNVVYGFGRRVCPGKAFADISLWITCANVVATMDLFYAKDSAGKDVIPEGGFYSGFISHPKEFECVFRPRSENIRKQIAHMHAMTVDA